MSTTPAIGAAQPPESPSSKSTDSTSELIFMSTLRLAELIRVRRVSAVEAVEAYIERQIAVNDPINAVVMNCFARARKEAQALDRRAARGDFAGPLHGVPMTIKDSLDTEGVISTGGTLGRKQYVPASDATVVARLRKAGAILLGKTNTSEFTLGGLGLNTTSNLLHGSTYNPYDLTRSAWSSSGGSAAAVAAGMAAFDIGSDWSGSIRFPAHNNGVAGLRPTSIRVPRTGQIIGYGGIGDLWQQIGPIARRVEDLELITPIISGPDMHDAACSPVPWPDPGKIELKKLRAAFARENGGVNHYITDQDTRDAVLQVAKWLEEAGMTVSEDAPASVLVELSNANDALQSGDGYSYFKRLAEKWGTKVISPPMRRTIEHATPLSTAELIRAWQTHDECKSRMLHWMSSYDVFVCPVDTTPARLVNSPADGGEDHEYGWYYAAVFSSTGWPVVVVRAGSSSDGKLPIGLQIVAAPWREDVALAVARYVETRSGGWRRPPI